MLLRRKAFLSPNVRQLFRADRAAAKRSGTNVCVHRQEGTTHDSGTLEYKTLRSYVYGDEFDKKLNNVADEGWTVVSSSTTQSTQTSAPYAVVILKREKMR